MWLCALAILVDVSAASTLAQAQDYPWCAYYGGREGGGRNCGFTTFEQCLATVSGIGGFCNRNPQYVPTATTGPRSRRWPLPRHGRHRHGHHQ